MITNFSILEKKDNIFLIIDSNGLLYSSYYIATKIGISTEYFFLKSFFSILSKINCKKVLFLFDGKDSRREGRRSGISEKYKINRSKTPDDLIYEMNKIKIFLEESGFKFIQIDKEEADDLICSITDILSEENYNFLIWTRDKDMFQLINNKLFILKQGGGNFKIYNWKIFFDEYGFHPNNFIDYLSLMGDKSDNIPGLNGIGDKYSKELIRNYGNIENILANIDNFENIKLKKIFFNHEIKEILFLNRKLIKLYSEIKIFDGFFSIISDSELNLRNKINKIVNYCKINGFFSIIKLLNSLKL